MPAEVVNMQEAQNFSVTRLTRTQRTVPPPAVNLICTPHGQTHGGNTNDVNQIAEEIVAREGGYVNDPDDPGGATNFGLTIHTDALVSLDRDGVVTEQDVRVVA
jgi:hypothetical protein